LAPSLSERLLQRTLTLLDPQALHPQLGQFSFHIRHGRLDPVFGTGAQGLRQKV
jgi:hypothetical protein